MSTPKAFPWVLDMTGRLAGDLGAIGTTVHIAMFIADSGLDRVVVIGTPTVQLCVDLLRDPGLRFKLFLLLHDF